jgi:ribonuclease G
MQGDIAYLTKLWGDLNARARDVPAPALLYQDLSLAQRVLRDMATEETSRVLVDSRETYTKMMEFAREYTPALVERDRALPGRPAALRPERRRGGDRARARAPRQPEVRRLSDRRPDRGDDDDRRQHRRLRRRPQLRRHDLQDESRGGAGDRAAARLRNLGGIIIIDFIDMENADHRSAVLAELNRALEPDRTRLTVNGFTQLGLVEMTRKRTRESLAHVLCESCPTCQGRGELKTAQTICYEILREILREAKQFNAREFRILAAQPVIDLFLDEESQSLAQLGDFIGKPISLQVESIYTQEQYDIVLI